MLANVILWILSVLDNTLSNVCHAIAILLTTQDLKWTIVLFVTREELEVNDNKDHPIIPEEPQLGRDVVTRKYQKRVLPQRTSKRQSLPSPLVEQQPPEQLQEQQQEQQQEQEQENQQQHPQQQQDQAKGVTVASAGTHPPKPVSQTTEERHENHDTRTRIVKEIVETERSYVRALKELSETWEQPLRERLKTKPVLSEPEICSIFSIADGESCG